PGYVEVIYGGGVWSQTLDFSQVEIPNESPEITYPAHQQTGVPARPTIFWNQWSNPLKDGGVWVGIEETLTEDFVADDVLLGKTTSWTVSEVLDLNTQYSSGVVFYDYEFQRIDDVDVHISSWNESDINFTTGSLPPGPDLIGSFNDVSLEEIIVPGDKGAAEILISNVGDRPAQGKFTLNVFASPDQVLDQDDLLVGSIQNKSVKLNPGDAKNFKTKLLIPLDTPVDEYHLLAQIIPDSSIQERDTNNNITPTDGTGEVVWQFGSVGDRSNVQLKLQQPGGPLYTFALKGDGSGQINGGFNFDQLYLDGTTEATTVTVKSKEPITLNLINGDPSPLASPTSLGKLTGKLLTLGGNMDLTGSLGQLQIAEIADGVQINTAQPAPKGTTVKVNGIGNVLFDIDGLLNSLQANSFTAGLLSADAVNSVKIKRDDLGATIHAKTGDVNNISAAGNIRGDIIAENGSIIKVATKKGNFNSAAISARNNIVTVQGINLLDVVISAGGNINKITAKGNASDTLILAGYDRFVGGMQGVGDGDVLAVSVSGNFFGSFISAGVLPPVPDLQDVLPGVQPPYTGLGYTGNIGKVKFGAVDQNATADFGLFAATDILPIKVGKTTLTKTDPAFNPHFLIEDQQG
ncbi:MAG: hypothetical protein GY869_00210, partial [Planctomycetes bacterium]|nr:hypothetical protein [Planctomycetota bacterium]